jgi:hypothetical protein
MGWTPEQALEAVATMAADVPTPKMRAAMPLAGLQAIMAPQAEKLAYAEVEEAQRAKSAEDKAKAQAARTRGPAAKKAAAQAQVEADAKELAAEEAVTAAKKLAEDPVAFLKTVEERRAATTPERFNRLIREIYGEGGYLAVSKLIAERRKNFADTIQRAKSAQGAAADRAEEERFKSTQETRDAITKAGIRQVQQDVTDKERTMEDVREFGLQAQKWYQTREPTRQWMREFATIGEGKEKEQAAALYWAEHISEEEKRDILSEYNRNPRRELTETNPENVIGWKWRQLTAQQKWDALTAIGLPTESPTSSPALESPPSLLWPPLEEQPQSQPGPVGPVSYNYDHRVIHQTIFNPVVGMNKQDLRIEPPYLG